MLKFEKGNIVTGNYPIFCQQVNCKGVMGAGLAKQIKEKYPEVYNYYKPFCDDGVAELGACNYIPTKDKRICICMYAQDGYGRNKRYTDYEAFKKCLEHIEFFMKFHPKNKPSIAFPYGIGCGLAGGDWYIILGMLKDFAEKIPQDVIIVEKE